jgi:DNA-binding MarR family transcriptional regulator
MAALDMVVLGLGLGMVMQVLVLAVQNAVDYKYLGVATSGSTMFRSIGGAIGVSLFGAIFTNRLQTELAQRLPASTHLPSTTSPATIRALPPGVHDSYVHALTAALSPVFLVAAIISSVAFVLALLLPDVPLRQTSAAEGIGEAFASPRDGDSERELERVLSVIARREERWRAYEELAARAEVDLPPTELWALCRLAEYAPASPQVIAAATGVDDGQLERALEELGRGGLVAQVNGAYDLTLAGQGVFDVIVRVKRATLEELVRDWSPEDHAQLEPMLDRLARSLASEMPTPA